MENTKRFDVNRRTVVRTAAWAAPAVAVVSAAPAYAATGVPNLSTSVLSAAPTRANDGSVLVAANSLTFINSGGGDVLGLSVSVSLGPAAVGVGDVSAAGVPNVAPPGSITDVLLMGTPYPGVTGIGTGSVSFDIPDSLVTIAPGGQYSLAYGLEFVTNENRARTATVEVTPLNGGTGTNFAPIPFAALNVPNLSQSLSTGLPSRHNATQINVPPTTFKNTGTLACSGARVTVEANREITRLQANVPVFGLQDLNSGLVGCTYEIAPGPGVTKVIFRTAASGAGQMNVAPGAEKTSSAPQRWTVGAGQFEFTSTIEPVTGPIASAPANGIGVRFRPDPVA